jgi:CYTH domain-containing protein
MRVLVTAATRPDATREIAQAVAAGLTARGVGADAVAIDDVRRLDGYDAAVIGSALYMGRWSTAAREFIEANASALVRMPVWLFSFGPQCPPEHGLPAGEPADASLMVQLSGARDHRVCAGDCGAVDAFAGEVATALLQRSARTTEAPPAGVEIERKFVVGRAPADLDSYRHAEIEQGYVALDEDGVEVRVRRYGPRAVLTVKSSGDRTRVEEEIEIDQRRFRSLWPLTEGRRVEKTRYRVPAAHGEVIDLDVYHGALKGLVTAEVEFASQDAAEAFDPPAWFGAEVTKDARYKNKRLATEGLPA